MGRIWVMECRAPRAGAADRTCGEDARWAPAAGSYVCTACGSAGPSVEWFDTVRPSEIDVPVGV